MISHKALEAITPADIASLIENRVPEGRTLDYKQELTGRSDEDHRELLADVSSFANTTGGVVLFGVVEERDAGKTTGIPASAPGLSVTGDAELRRIEDIIRDGIEPRVPGVRLRAVDGFAKGAVVVLRIPRSWRGPHMVTFRNYSRFFARAASGKYQLDVQQIRDAFVASASLRERVEAFRLERLQALRNQETTAPPMEAGGRIVLHVIPVAGFDSPESVDLDLERARPRPLFAQFGVHRYNFDGVLGYEPLSGSGSQRCAGYVQLFRSGAIEAVDGELLPRMAREHQRLIPSLSFEGRLIDWLTAYLTNLREWRVPPPFLVALSLLDVKGFKMAFAEAGITTGSIPIDRSDLIIPAHMVEEIGHEDLRREAARVLRAPLDIVWQSAGIAKSPNFDDAGLWNAAARSY